MKHYLNLSREDIFGLLSESNLNELGIKLNHEIRQTAYQSILKENNYKKLMNSRFIILGALYRVISLILIQLFTRLFRFQFSLSITGILAYR